MIKKATDWACKFYSSRNLAYDANIEMHEYCQILLTYLRQHFEIIPVSEREELISAIWLIGTGKFVSYNELHTIFGLNIAEIVYLVTVPKGRTTEDKCDLKFFIELRQNLSACMIFSANIVLGIKNIRKYIKQGNLSEEELNRYNRKLENYYIVGHRILEYLWSRYELQPMLRDLLALLQ